MKIKDIPWYGRPGFRLSREGVEKLTNSNLFFTFFVTNLCFINILFLYLE